MKGAILVGGSSMRFYLLTKVTSKRPLPVYDKPTIYYPLPILMTTGIRDVLIILTPEDIPYSEESPGDGSQFEFSLFYTVQPSPDDPA